MSAVAFSRRSPWIPTLIVLAVVLIAGSRLIVLSVQEHSAQAHKAAQLVADNHVQLIRAELQRLVDLAKHPPARDSAALQARNVASLEADGKLLTSPNADRTLIQGIVDEWRSTKGHAQAFATELLGPIRYGSTWVVAVMAPSAESSAMSTDDAEPARRSIA